MSRPVPAPTGAAADARAALPDDAHPGFDRLVHAVLTAHRQPLGAVLRAQLPGTSGVRWLRTAGLPATARPGELTAEQWLSLHTEWLAHAPVPRGGTRPAGAPRADSRHGHAPGAQAIPRYF
ncbi:hypothetical protein [Modestobacter sp. NPDC049651]|uniref:hypothetical protein n=1 Tax=unclassified Modestobacter TaxID=2643866 RepID=UPI00340C056E